MSISSSGPNHLAPIQKDYGTAFEGPPGPVAKPPQGAGPVTNGPVDKRAAEAALMNKTIVPTLIITFH